MENGLKQSKDKRRRQEITNSDASHFRFSLTLLCNRLYRPTIRTRSDRVGTDTVMDAERELDQWFTKITVTGCTVLYGDLSDHYVITTTAYS